MDAPNNINRRQFLAASLAALIIQEHHMRVDTVTIDDETLTYGTPPKRYTLCYPDDVFGPNGDVQHSYPGIVFLHGGGWVGGDRNSHMPLMQALAAEGMIVASLDYTLAIHENAPALPKMIDDITAGIAMLESFAPVVGQHVSLCGCSAGGHLTLLYAMTRSHSLRAAISLSGVVNLRVVEQGAALGGESCLPNLLGAGYTAAQRDLASPACLSVLNYRTPTLLLQGEADPFLPFCNAGSFYLRLYCAGVPVSLVRLQGGDHCWDASPTLAAGVICSGY
jgi:acetyl esterase/lipase